MPIDPEVVRHVARLARLALSDEEVERFSHELGSVLEHVDALAHVDVTGVEPLVHPFALASRLREDVPAPGIDREKLLEGAPSVEDGMFRVPRIL